MGFDSLKLIMPPPLVPQEVTAADDWHAVEQELSTSLPDDYRAFVRAYGTGTINHFMVIFNPFSANRFVRLDRDRVDLEGLSKLIADFPEIYPHALYPSPGGLLPFAATDNGNVLYWRTIGTPDRWTVRVFEARGPSYYDFNGRMTDFLEALLTRSIECGVLPRSFPSGPPIFEPITRDGKKDDSYQI